MKLYHVMQGTSGKLIVQEPNVDVEVKDWVTRKNLTFSEVLLDPIRLHNNRGSYDHSSLAVQLVERGYALFGGETGGEPNAKYTLAVRYNEVSVSA